MVAFLFLNRLDAAQCSAMRFGSVRVFGTGRFDAGRFDAVVAGRDVVSAWP
ncbi:hypothetical protein ABZ865_40030 [Streptomyces sp. NPDC047085]|uniref:hypothetical protein n=1 Tax=Streptomyces sp. NPDC047085 TaxID=3155140 RepID=UPI0033E97AEA